MLKVTGCTPVMRVNGLPVAPLVWVRLGLVSLTTDNGLWDDLRCVVNVHSMRVLRKQLAFAGNDVNKGNLNHG